MAGERNYARFYVLLKQLPPCRQGHACMAIHTGAHKVAQKRHQKWEYDVMCRDMERVVNNDNKAALKQTALRKARSAILHQLQIYGLDTTDWATVDAFCKTPE